MINSNKPVSGRTSSRDLDDGSSSLEDLKVTQSLIEGVNWMSFIKSNPNVRTLDVDLEDAASMYIAIGYWRLVSYTRGGRRSTVMSIREWAALRNNSSKTLENLSVHGMMLMDVDIGDLASSLIALKNVTFYYSDISSRILQGFGHGIEKLKLILIGSLDVADLYTLLERAAPTLKSLTLLGLPTTPTPIWIQKINFPQLEYLELDSSMPVSRFITENSTTPVKRNSLKTLVILCLLCDDDMIIPHEIMGKRLAASFPNLTSLTICYMNMRDNDLFHIISKLRYLTNLELNYIGAVNDEELPTLCGNLMVMAGELRDEAGHSKLVIKGGADISFMGEIVHGLTSDRGAQIVAEVQERVRDATNERVLLLCENIRLVANV